MILVAPMICMVLAQPATVTLSGTVAGPDGKPVAGAEVRLTGLPVHDPPIAGRARTDAEGRFAIERPARMAGETHYTTPVLWVVKPGYRLSVTRFTGPLPGPGEPVRVVLAPPGKAEVRVEAPDGAPVVGARVRVEWFGPGGYLHLPEEVEDLIETKTGPDGRAAIEAVANEDVTYIDVVSDAFGIQGRPFLPASPRPKRIQLRPATSLEGRLAADDPTMARGWQVSAYTRVGDPWSRHPETTGYAQATTDDRGRFSLPAIAVGSLQLELKPPRDLPVLAQLPPNSAVVPGKKNVVEVPLRQATTVTGIFRERGTNRPIPGVELYFTPLGEGRTDRGQTDAQGRYLFRTLPGKMRLSVFNTPPTHAVAPGGDWKDFTVPEGVDRVELDPRELIPAAPPLRFVVRDEAGRPAAHAIVSGSSPSRYMPRTTDERGEFAILGMPPGGQAEVEVRLGERMTDGRVAANAGGTEPVPVTIVPGLAVAIAGRVLRPGGAPVSGADVKIKFREKAPGGRFHFPQEISLGEGNTIPTGPDGTFRTPREIYRKNREFRAEVTAEGYLPGQTDWLSIEGGDLLTLPDLVLHPEETSRPIAVRVIDRQGKGVAGAAVFLSIGDPPGITDGDGRCRIDEAPGGTTIVFAEKAGFRFGGAIVGPAEEVAEIRLARVEEPPISAPRTQPPLPRAEERALAREWLGPLVAAARAGSLGQIGQSVLPTLARIDPDRVLQMIDNRAVTPTPSILVAVVLGQFETDPAAAVATIEDDRDPAVRGGCFLAIADLLPGSDREARTRWIERAQAEAGRVEDRDSRITLLGQVADHWLGLDRLDRAKPLLREGQAIAAEMPKDRYSFAVEPFAEVLAAIDLPAARPIFERKGVTNVGGADTGTTRRHLAEAAIRLATIDPAEAERLVPVATENLGDVKGYVLRIAARMARVDVPRARRILESIDRRGGPSDIPWPPIQPRGLGLMALARAEVDPAGARKLLDEAYDRLRAMVIAGRDSQQNVNGTSQDVVASVLMAALLPVVERVEPDRLEERLWLAAAVRAPDLELPFLQYVRPRVSLGMLVSRYNRPLAEAILGPALERLPGLITDAAGLYYNQSTLIKDLTAYDPRAVVALLRALPASARKVPEPKDQWNVASLDTQIRLIAAEVLGMSFEERRRKIFEVDLHSRVYGWD